MPQKNRISELLKGHMAGNLTEQELEELQLLMDDEQNAEVIRNLLAEMMEEEVTDNAYDAERFDLVFNNVVGIDRFNKSASQKNKGRIFKIKWLRYAAAAFVILVAGVYFLSQKSIKPFPKIPATTVTVSDLPPGSNKAMLTLSNGKKIDLISSQDTFSDGNVNIKNANGELIYNLGNIPSSGATETDVVYNTVTTPRGGQYKLSLPDGTRVWLNASSSITFPTAFNSNKRSVDITGEVYFEVVHNTAKPFFVHVNEMEVEVLGTHFNINGYDDEEMMKTTLLEGSVMVRLNQKMDNSRLQSIILKPGEQAQIMDKNIKVQPGADLEQTVAWKNGVTSFKNADIKTIMRQVSRWYDVDVAYEGTAPATTFNGEVSRQANVSKVLSIFDFAGIRCRIEGKKIVVMP